MKATITKPDGTKLKIDGEQVCFGDSPDKCHTMPPEIIKLMVHRAWHLGWRVHINVQA